MSRPRVLSYALGDVANNLSFLMTSTFLMVYMTDIAGIPAAAAGTIYAVTKVWAGVTDLLAGSTVDRANTRWGRLRPWILWGSTPLAIVFVLLFSAPANLTVTQAIAWVFLFDALFQLVYSFVNIPYGSLAAAMTQDSVDRSRLSGARSIASAVTGVVLSAVVSPQFQDTAADGVRLRFTLTAAALGVIAVVLYLLCFRNTREVVPRSPGKVKLARTLSMVRHNKPLLVLCAGAFFLLGAMFTMSAVGMYYARDVLGNAGYFTFLMLGQTVGTVLAASLVPTITVRLGKRGGYVTMAGVAVLGYVLVFLVPAGGQALLIAIIAWFIFGVGSGGSNALMFSMQADTVDYGEWRTGVRSEGGSYSVLSFVRKSGQGLGGAIGAAVIGAFGYVAAAPTQTADAVLGIRVATGAVPAVLGVVAALIMLLYPLTTQQHRELVAELTERRTQGVAATTGGGAVPADAQLGDGRTTIVTSRGIRPVVTFFGEYGSGATTIAARVAERLDVPFVGQAMSSAQVAATAPAGLRSAGAWERFVRSVAYTATNDTDLARGAEATSDYAMVVENTRSVIDSLRDGGVLVGRNGTVILGKAVGALHIRLTAPTELRVSRVAADVGVAPERARELVAHEDEIRAEISRRLYGWDPDDEEHYDLVINTGTFTYGHVVDLIIEAYRHKYPA
ncbi:MFS transporter [Georgenia subflava]|uniref:MFS transporter n=1 Tax=Georgenia subflava TaxID=1622177 RepID=A0A6N7EMF0_9MICO|nr:MFS transporter [Georgenia subflava]